MQRLYVAICSLLSFELRPNTCIVGLHFGTQILFIQALPCWVTSKKLCFLSPFSQFGCFLLGIGLAGCVFPFYVFPPPFVKHSLNLLLKNTRRARYYSYFAPYPKELTEKISSMFRLRSNIPGMGPK